MTLTDVLPSLRRTLPDPLGTNLWPAFTQATIADVVVAGVSMRRLVDLCGTPCVHTADAVIPGTGGRRSALETTTVLCTSVTAVLPVTGSVRTVVIDACIDSLTPCWEETRLIGRTSTSHRLPTRILSRATMTATLADLPDDIVVGDLLAVPCPGTATHHDLVPSPA